ncbi:protein FAR1-RELATED SEQUENCE 5-like [Arachis ipaensis]|uniref:protein FAR1-RELATED SEQUENCE 5-like n=1 Tax=Arachis ipaensis TaxID=130454 RepID=UPI0007AFBB91|nr:protein FAR1-RELATED SEQUENCE 5-like [Arachis ipaensis]
MRRGEEEEKGAWRCGLSPEVMVKGGGCGGAEVMVMEVMEVMVMVMVKKMKMIMVNGWLRLGGGFGSATYKVSREVGAAEAGQNIFLMSSCSRMIHKLDAENEENFNVSEDIENCDAMETPVDTEMKAEAEELEGESPDERHGEQNVSAEHVMLSRAQILEMKFTNPDEKADSTSWYVYRFVDEHNHDLLPAKFVSYLPAYRKISDVDVAHIESLRQVGISIPKIYESIAAQVGDEQQMCDLFWSDGCSQHDYKIFGDVLAFDATYGRNKYNLPVIVFFGVNHHNQTCVFGAAMVSSETQAAYVWVLGRFLECMGGKAPKAVITDGDRAMRLAIQEVFPEAHHRLCAWHLLKNATVNVCKPRFTTLLRNCMLADVEVEEFERQWEAMMDECRVWEVEWVKDLYAKKMSWAMAYICGCFYAGLRTTSRCESLHAKMGRFVERRYGILEFVTNFQRCVDFLRDNEEELDFRSLYGSPVLQTQFSELKKSGTLNYTKEIFLRFRDALERSVRITIVECNKLDNRTVYVTQKYRRPQFRWTVAHHFREDSFFCSCLRFESFGLPCVHILAVLVQLDIGCLLESIVMERWSKTCKVELEGSSPMNEEGDVNALYKVRVGAFLQHCKRLARVACMRENDFKSYLEKIVEETLSWK